MLTRTPQVRSLRTLEYVLGDDPAVVRGYAKAAADAMQDGPLTLDTRSRLLARGERLGIRRFDANLILAAIEQREKRLIGWQGVAPVRPNPRRSWFLHGAVAALGIQSAIAIGAWWLLR